MYQSVKDGRYWSKYRYHGIDILCSPYTEIESIASQSRTLACVADQINDKGLSSPSCIHIHGSNLTAMAIKEAAIISPLLDLGRFFFFFGNFGQEWNDYTTVDSDDIDSSMAHHF